MRISSHAPLTSFNEILKLKQTPVSALKASLRSDTLSEASSDTKRIYPLACWYKDGFHIIARFDLVKGVLIDIYQNERRINLKAHLHLPHPIIQKTESRTREVLANAQRTLTDMSIDLKVKQGEVHITLKQGLKGGMASGPIQAWGEVEPTNEPLRTKTIARVIRNGEQSERIEYEHLALSCVKAFEKGSKRPQDIAELVELAHSSNPELTRAVISSLLKPLQEKTLLDPMLLLGLSRAIQYSDPRSLDPTDHVSLLKYLKERLEKLSSTDERRLTLELSAISSLLDAMVAADVEGISRSLIHKSLMQKLSSLVKHSRSEVSQLAKNCEQALLRLPSDESKIERLLRRALHAGEGVSLLTEAWNQKSLSSAMGAFQEFHKAFKPDKRKSVWYDSLQFIKLLIAKGKYAEAAQIISKVSVDHQGAIKALLSRMIASLPKKEQVELKRHLTDLQISAATQLPKPGSALIREAKSTLNWSLHELKNERLHLGDEDALYIPLDATIDPRSQDRCNLFKVAQDFLDSDKQVLLIQGGSGAGKSMFLRLMERSLWDKSSSANAPIPIHVELRGINPKTSSLIEDALAAKNFKAEQITELKSSKNFVLFLDGYDEIPGGQLVNLYEHAGLKSWPGKVVISCRSQHLANVDQWRRYFAPFRGDTPNVNQLKCLYVVPFSEKQVRSYLDKFLEMNPISGWSVDRYVSLISQIKGLKDLIESPFVLRMTAEVLPHILTEDAKAVDLSLTRRNLYEAFSTQWFERQEKKLIASNQKIPPELKSFQKECLRYCQDLALEMVRSKVVEAPYTPMTLFSEGEDPSPFRKFFGADEKSAILRGAVPVTNRSSGCAFLHKSLLEHYASGATTRELEELSQTHTKPTDSKMLEQSNLKSPRAAYESSAFERFTAFDIQTTKDLSRALKSQDLSERDRGALIQLAIDTIESFSSKPYDSARINELIELAAAGDQDIVRRAFEELIHPIGKDTLTDLRLIEGLSRAVAFIDTSSVNPSHLMTCLEVVQERLSTLHQSNAEASLVHHLRALEQLTSAILDTGVTTQSSQVKKMLDTLGGISSKNLQVIAARKCLKQAILRLDTNEDRLSTWLERGEHISSGISSLTQGVGSYSPKKVVEGLISFRQATKQRGKKHLWYDELRAADLLIKSGDMIAYQELELMPNEPHAQLLLLELLNKGAKTTLDEMVRGAWISEMVSLACRGDGEVKGYAKSLLEGYKEYDAPEVTRAVGFGLSQLQDVQVHPCISSNLPSEGVTKELIAAGKTSIQWHLAGLKSAALNDHNVLQEGRFHVPLNAAHKNGGSKASNFPLDEGVKRFLNDSTKPVMLLLGNSGSGKSLSMKLLCTELWKSHQEGDSIPLFISLTGVERSSKTIIQDALKASGFSEQQIMELQQDHTFILILDGYDEMNGTENINLVQSNDLYTWPGKVILTCRTQYAKQIPGGYERVFIPRDNEGKLHREFYQEITTVPFSYEQRAHYLKKFCSQTETHWTPDLYLEYIQRIPKLEELIETPFVLRILTEVLPGIVEKHGANDLESLKLTRADFYEAFVRHWFDRQFDKLIRGGWGNLSPSETDSYYTYAVELASKMHTRRLTEVSYKPTIQLEEETNPFACFFASEPPLLVRARTACPLVVSRRGNSVTYRFFHKSLLDFLGGREVFSEADLDAEGLEEALLKATEKSNIREVEDNELAPASSNFHQVPDIERLIGSSLNSRLVYDMGTLRFWVDDVNQKEGFRENLFEIIELSKNHPEVAIAAANAMTILVGSGHSFARADLSGIRVPGALLDRGNFSHANLARADLRGCSMHEAFLASANCQEAQLENVDWVQYRSLSGHKSRFKCVAYSSNGKLLASASSNHIYLWQLEKKDKRLKVLKFANQSCINSIQFSPDGRSLAGASESGLICIWSIEKGGKLARVFKGHKGLVDNSFIMKQKGLSKKRKQRLESRYQGSVKSISYSPDGNYLASGGSDTCVHLWDLESKANLIHVLEGHEGTVYCVSYSPCGKFLASGSGDMTIRMWDAINPGKALLTLNGQTETDMIHLEGKIYRPSNAGVYSISYSPDGKKLVSGGADKVVRVWNIENREEVPLELKGHEKPITSVAFSSDGSQIASGSKDRTVKFWDLVDGGEPRVNSVNNRVEIASLAYTPKGKEVASVCEDSIVRLWRNNDKAYLLNTKEHTEVIWSISFSPDGSRIATSGHDKTIRVWDSAKKWTELFKLSGHENSVAAVSFSPDGTIIASGSFDETVRLWDAQTGGNAIAVLPAHNSIISLAFSPDGSFLVTGGPGRSLIVWNMRDKGNLASELYEVIEDVKTVAFSPSGKRLALGNLGAIWVWDHQIESRPTSPLRFETIYISREERIDEEKKFKKSFLALHGHEKPITSVNYSPCGKYIVSGSEDKTVRLWDAIKGGKALRVLRGHARIVTSASFTQNGAYIISGSIDGTVRVWDALKRKNSILTFSGFGAVHSLSTSPDRSIVAVGSLDGNLYVNKLLLESKTGGKGNKRVKSFTEWRSGGPLACTGLNITNAEMNEETLKLLKELGAEDGGVSSNRKSKNCTIQ